MSVRRISELLEYKCMCVMVNVLVDIVGSKCIECFGEVEISGDEVSAIHSDKVRTPYDGIQRND